MSPYSIAADLLLHLGPLLGVGTRPPPAIETGDEVADVADVELEAFSSLRLEVAEVEIGASSPVTVTSASSSIRRQ